MTPRRSDRLGKDPGVHVRAGASALYGSRIASREGVAIWGRGTAVTAMSTASGASMLAHGVHYAMVATGLLDWPRCCCRRDSTGWPSRPVATPTKHGSSSCGAGQRPARRGRPGSSWRVSFSCARRAPGLLQPRGSTGSPSPEDYCEAFGKALDEVQHGGPTPSTAPDPSALAGGADYY